MADAVEITPVKPKIDLTFSTTGPQVGERLPPLELPALKDGQVESLDSWWRGQPTLVITSSWTCPKSRTNWSPVAELADKFGDKLRIIIIYVIEAHPIDDVCPYKGVEDVTAENRRDGILHRQPRTLDDRMELARAFKQKLKITPAIYVDTLDNLAWKSLGAAPNCALLLNSDGKIVVRQGWIDGPALIKPIQSMLNARDTERTRDEDNVMRENTLNIKVEKLAGDRWELSRVFTEGNVAKAADLIKAWPELPKYVEPYEARGHSGGCTMLWYAAHKSHVKLVELLLKHGADVNAHSENKSTALVDAIENDKPEMVQFLIERGADINLRHQHVLPVNIAVIVNNPKLAGELIKLGAKSDFFTSVGLGKMAEVKSALATDPSRAFRPDGLLRLPIEYAASNGQIDTAKLLLKEGIPLKTSKHRRAKQPLHWAAEQNQAEMAKLLLDAGACVDDKIEERGSALHLAASHGSLDVAKVLLKHGADTSLRNMYTQTPLHVAASQGKSTVAAALIEASADLEATTKAYDTPCGPPGGHDATLDTPLHLAATSGYVETIDVLLQGGAKLQARNANKHTPLLAAMAHRKYSFEKLDAVEHLIRLTGKPSAGDQQTAWDMAKENQDEALQQLLKHHGWTAGKAANPAK